MAMVLTPDFLDALVIVGVISAMTTLVCPALLWALTYKSPAAEECAPDFGGTTV